MFTLLLVALACTSGVRAYDLPRCVCAPPPATTPPPPPPPTTPTPTPPPCEGSYDCGSNNPCGLPLVSVGDTFKNSDANLYVECTANGCEMKSCGSNAEFDCLTGCTPLPTTPEPTPSPTTPAPTPPQCGDGPFDCDSNNPCVLPGVNMGDTFESGIANLYVECTVMGCQLMTCPSNELFTCDGCTPQPTTPSPSTPCEGDYNCGSNNPCGLPGVSVGDTFKNTDPNLYVECTANGGCVMKSCDENGVFDCKNGCPATDCGECHSCASFDVNPCQPGSDSDGRRFKCCEAPSKYVLCSTNSNIITEQNRGCVKVSCQANTEFDCALQECVPK